MRLPLSGAREFLTDFPLDFSGVLAQVSQTGEPLQPAKCAINHSNRLCFNLGVLGGRLL